MPSSPYRYADFEFDTAEGVFVPTQTSQLLIKSARQVIDEPGRLLDLGCGIGICGLVLGKLGLCKVPVFFSDLSERATAVARENARKLNVPAEIRQGPLFAPWEGECFDDILADVPGISQEIARLSPWFPQGVECQTGRDGTALIVQVLEHAPKYLNRGGILLFPVLSLSNANRILEAARAHFAEVALVSEQTWFLPEELTRHFDKLQPLREEGAIQLKQKVGMWLWSIKVYRASNALSQQNKKNPDCGKPSGR